MLWGRGLPCSSMPSSTASSSSESAGYWNVRRRRVVAMVVFVSRECTGVRCGLVSREIALEMWPFSS
jgi:hypothetical protein